MSKSVRKALGVVGMLVGKVVSFVNPIIGLAISAVSAAVYASGVKKPKTPNASALGSEITLSGDPLAPRKVIYGEAWTAGTLRFRDAAGTDNVDLYMVIALAGHEIDSVTEVQADLETLTLDGSGNCTAPAKWVNLIQVRYVLGTDAQAADSTLVSTFTDWTTNHRLRGIAYAIVKVTYDADNMTQPPSFRFKVKGRKVYDPRLDSTNGGSGSHRLATPSTWEWSNNAVLCANDYMRGVYINSKLVAGIGIASGRFDWTNVTAEANVCDEDVTLGGSPSIGTEDRYTANGVIDPRQGQTEILRHFEVAIAGDIAFSDGAWRFFAGAYRTPTLHLLDQHFIGPLKHLVHREESGRYDTIQGSYASEEEAGTPVGYHPVSLSGVSPGTERQMQLDMLLVNDVGNTGVYDGGARAQRIAKLMLERENAAKTIQCTTNLYGLRCMPGETIQITRSSFGLTGQSMRVIDVQLRVVEEDGKTGAVVDLLLESGPSTLYSWTAEETFVDAGTALDNKEGPGAGAITLYYIKPTQGTAIKNGVGTLTVEAHRIADGVDELLSAGTIQLYDTQTSPPTLITSANGYVAGSDGYTGILDAGDITDSTVVSLRDGAGGTDLDTITLVDVADGAAGSPGPAGSPGTDGTDAVIAWIEPDASLAWTRDVDQVTWTPATTQLDFDCFVARAGVVIARRAWRITRSGDGTLTGATIGHKDGDLDGSPTWFTITELGEGSRSITIQFDFNDGTDAIQVSETAHSSLSGAQGSPGATGPQGSPGTPGDDGEIYYLKPITGTAIKNGSGTLTVEAHHVVGAVDTHLSTGTIKIYDTSTSPPTEVTVANGYAAGSDGYTGVLDSGDINGAAVLKLSDGAGGAELDTITLVDILDGAQGSPGPPGIDADLYYIKPVTGTAIHNSVGTLTFEARYISGGTDSLLAAGTIQLYDTATSPPTLITVGNGYATGSDGYTGVLDSGDINGDTVISLRDGSGGTDLDTVTAVDIADGATGAQGSPGDDAVYGHIEPSGSLAWVRAVDQSTWTPAATTVDFDCYFYEAGSAVARIAWRITRAADGTLTGATTPHKDGDLNTGRVTVTETNESTGAMQVEFAYSFGGKSATVAEQAVAVLSGAQGSPGVIGPQGSPGNDGEFYYIKPTNGTAIHNGTGTLTLEAHHVVGNVDTHLSTGTIKLFDTTPSPDLEVTVANGYATGSDGYTGVFDSGDIGGDTVVKLSDGAGGAALDTITLVDIADGAAGAAGSPGLDGTFGFIEATDTSSSPPVGQSIAWVRQTDQSTWVPSATTIDLHCTIVRGGSTIGRYAWRVTRDASGILTGAAGTHKNGNLNVGNFTVTEFGENSQSFTIQFDYSDGTGQAVVGESVNTSLSGAQGSPGPAGSPGTAGSDAVYGYIEPSGPLVWIRDSAGTWDPTATTLDFDVFFVQGGAEVARVARRITRDASGYLTASSTTHKDTDLNAGRVTVTDSLGSGTRSHTLGFTYSFGGDTGYVAETASSNVAAEDPTFFGGAVLNKDPFFYQLDKYWFTSLSQAVLASTIADWEQVSSTAVPEGRTALSHAGPGRDDLFSERIPCNPDNTYALEFAVANVTTTEKAYILVCFYDEDGVNINSSSTPLSDAVGWDEGIGTYHYTRYANDNFPTSGYARHQTIFGAGGEATIPSNAKEMAIGGLIHYGSVGSADMFINYLRVKDLTINLTKLPANFGSGHVGGADDFQYRVNFNTSTSDPGEILVIGTTFEHPDGTTRSLAESKQYVATPYETRAGRFFLMWTDTVPWTRFGGTEDVHWFHEEIVAIAWEDDDAGWYAHANNGTRYYFTPAATDAIIAAGVSFGNNAKVDDFVKMTGNVNNPESAQLGVIFKETFEGYLDDDDFKRSWEKDGSDADTVAFVNEGLFGGAVIQMAADQGRYYHRELLPFDPNALYKMSTRIRKKTGDTASPETSDMFMGLVGVAANGTTLVNRTGANSTSSQHYILHNDTVLTTADGWQERSIYFQGVSTASPSLGDVYSAESLTPLGPSVLHENVRYMRPYIIANNSAPQDGTWQIDYFIIEKILQTQETGLVLDPFFSRPFGEAWVTDPAADEDASIGSGEYGGGLVCAIPAASTDIQGARNDYKFEVVNGQTVQILARLKRTGADTSSNTQGTLRLAIGVHVYDLDGTLLGSHRKLYLNTSTQLGALLPSAGTYYTKRWEFDIDQAPTSKRFYAQVYAYFENVSETGTFGAGDITFDSILCERVVGPRVYSGYCDATASAEIVPDGWSITKGTGATNGQYTVTHNLVLSPLTQLRINPTLINSSFLRIWILSQAANSFIVQIQTTGGAQATSAWNFQATIEPSTQ